MALLIINHVVGDYETFSRSSWTTGAPPAPGS